MKPQIRRPLAWTRIIAYVAFLTLPVGLAFPQTELVTNGGFESASTGWVLSGNFYADSRFAYPHSGTGYAYVSDPDGWPGNNLIGSMYQSVTIPTNATSVTLTFWYNITSEETIQTPFDVLNITLKDSNGGYLATVAVFSNLHKDSAPGNPFYHQKSFDMTPYKGQTVRLHFLAATDGSKPTVFRIDDVSIVAAVPPLIVVSTSPADGDLAAPVTDTITATFSENIQAGTLSVLIVDETGASVPIKSVTVSGKTLTISLKAILAHSTGYGVGIDAGAVKNSAGNPNLKYIWAFRTEDPKRPDKPTLISPLNNAPNVSITPTLRWDPVSRATGYIVQVSKNRDFTDKVFDQATKNTYVQVSLARDTQYFWRVLAGIDSVVGPWSDVWTFSTIPYSPVADFSFSPTTGCAPLAVGFTDTSSNNPTSWSWNFGDGGTSSQRNPSHTYSSPGSYNVTLTVSNAAGSDSETKTIAVKGAPVANFSFTPTSGCAPLTVSFNDQSSNSPTSWSWSFGDGGTSTQQNPSHTYQTGGSSYTITLTVSNSCGSSSISKAIYVDTVKVKIQLAKQEIAVGETTTSDVLIESVSNLGGFEFKLYYNPNIIEIREENVQKGDFVSSSYFHALGPHFKNVGGLRELTYGVSFLGEQPGSSGSGFLAHITVKGLRAGITPLTLENVLVIDATSGMNQLIVNTTDSSITITPSTGTINVTTNLSKATFNITGPENYSGSGTSWTKTDVPAGIYTITYGDVTGYTRPASETKTLSAGGSISFIGAYIDNIAPTPNIIAFISVISATRIDITSIEAVDPTPPIYYRLDGQFYNGASWIDDGGGVSDYDWSTIRPSPFTDAGLFENGLYRYRQQVKDSASPANESAWSGWQEKAALLNPPGDAEISFSNVVEAGLHITVAIPLKPSGSGQTAAYFDLITGVGKGAGAFDRGWADDYTAKYSNLEPNTQYGFKVKYRNYDGVETIYNPTEQKKYTLANKPSAPTVSNPTSTTLDVNVNPNSNPDYTLFAIYNATGGYYVGANGEKSDGSSPVWQTYNNWGTVPVKNLISDTEYEFKVRAKNGEGVLTDFGPIGSGKTNPPPNTPPTISGLPDRIILDEDSSLDNAIDLWIYTLDAETADSGLTFSITGNTDPNCGVSIDSNRYIDINPADNWHGQSDITVKVTDPGGLSDTDAFRITVNSVNDPPEITSTPVTTAIEDTLYIYDVEATDPDVGDVLSYSLTTSPTGMTINSTTGLIQWTPTNDQVGDNNVVVQVADVAGATDIQSFIITVEEAANNPPVITSTPVTTGTEGVLYQYDVEATDADNDPLTFSLTTFPEGMTVDAVIGLISWTPSGTQAGIYDVVVQVSDGRGGSDTQSFTINVTEAINNPPVITSTPVTTGTEGVLYAYNVEATDADKDSLTYSLTVFPDGMTIDASTGLISWAPSGTQSGSHNVAVQVADGRGGTDTQSFTIAVAEAVNTPPVITSVPVTTGTQDVLYTYDAEASDADDDPLTFNLSKFPEGMTIDTNTGLINWTPTNGQVGDNDIIVQVDDGRGGTDSQSFTITVNPVYEPLAVDDAYSVDEDHALTIVTPGVLGNDITDLPSDVLAILVSDVSNGTLSLNTDGSFIYTPNADYNGTDSFTYKFSDGTVDSNTATASITVKPVNDPPIILSNIPDYSADKNKPIIINLTPYESDIEDSDTSLDWYAEGEDYCTVTGEYSDDDMLIFTPYSDFVGDDYITLYLKDSGSLTDSQQIKLTWQEVDTTPPTPNTIVVVAASATQLDVTSTEATDDTPPVYYRTEGQYYDGSTWTDSGGGVSDYEYSATRPVSWADTELLENGWYRYRQQVKDSATPANESTWSDWVEKATLLNPPEDAEITFANITKTGMEVSVATPPKPSGAGATAAYFDLITGEGQGSGATDRSYADDYTAEYTNLTPNTQYGWQVKYRNRDSAETAYNPTEQKRYTLADTPSAPTVSNPTSTTLDVEVNPSGNPNHTLFDLYNVTGGYYVNDSGGSNGASEVWQTKSDWGTVTVVNLTPETAYEFRCKAKNGDDIGTPFGPSGYGTTTALPDTIPPAIITNLAASSPTTNSITLTWTAPGDDGNAGTASQYDIKYSTSSITESNWDAATQCQGVPNPKSAGNPEIFAVTGLLPSTGYYFALKTADEVPNWSQISNVAQGTTKTPYAGPIWYVSTQGNDENDGSETHPYRTIQKGIDSAFDGDTVLVADGIYRGTGNVNLDFGGKAITVRSENGAENCIIDCENMDNTRGFYFHSEETSDSVVDGFTIRNGKAGVGGGLYCYSSSPTIINNTITGNSAASWGGGIYCQDNSAPTIRNNIITENSAMSGGGGIYCWGSAPTINSNTIAQSSAASGGGIYCWDSSPTITNNTITGNLADWGGGGVYCRSSSPTIRNNTIMGNEATELTSVGGGISCNDSSPMIMSNIIARNSADWAGGAISCYTSSPIITNNTIMGNLASNGGGIYCQDNSSSAITNTILWNNGPREIYFPSWRDPSTVTISHSDVQGGQAGIVTNNNGTVNWLDGNIDTDPLFVDAVNNDYHLSDFSPCIGAGIMTQDVPDTDIEGNPRPDPAGTNPDMGAYENGRLITLISPNGGEAWYDGTSQDITWGATVPGTDHIRLLYSTDGGSTYSNTIIDNTEDGGTYTWTVPALNSEMVRVQVIAVDSSNIALAEDASDGNFTITTIDNTPPETWAELAGTLGENNWWTSDVTVTLLATDGLSGVKETKYKIDNGPWHTYLLPFAIESSSTIYYKSEDNVGNVEAEESLRIKIDQTPPSRPVVTDDGSYTTSATRLHASWTAEDNESGIAEYQYAIGTAPRGTDVVGWTSTGMETEVTATGLSLANRQTYCFSVKAKNGAGTWLWDWQSGCSDGITVNVAPIVIHVPADYSTIQAAIDAAIHGDTVLVADGTYTGVGNVNLDFGGKAITVKSENGPDNCIIDCENTDNTRGVYFHSGETSDSVVDGVTIRNGKATSGGGIYCQSAWNPNTQVRESSSPTIMNNTITGNLASHFGGGIHCDSSSPTIENNIIMGNSADVRGGGICCISSSPSITSNTITGNNTTIFGGGICCERNSSPTINSNTIKDNSAKGGGGIYCLDYSFPTITDNTITGNSAEQNGGGIVCQFHSSPTITNNIISTNDSSGIYCLINSSPTITNNIIAGNSAINGSGVSCFDNCSPAITNNTITGNSANGNGGGIYCSKSSPTITNTIFWNNDPQEIYFQSWGDPSMVTISYSDVQGGQAGIVTNDNGTVNWLDGNIDADPLFVDAANGDYHLSDYSPCIGAGTADGAPATDIEGNARGTPPDIGAYENSRNEPLPPSITLTSPNGGEVWRGGSSQDITWNASGPGVDHIHLLYSIDGGTTYPNTIVASTDNDGIYEWNPVPSLNYATVRVKAIAEDSINIALAEDVSDGDFTIDSTVPDTSIALSGAQGDGGWYTSDVVVTLSATDNLSGIKETKYKVNDADWEIYSESFTVTGSTVNYKSEDKAGNLEAEKSQEIKIDKTAPLTPVVTDDGDYTSSATRLHALWTSSDPESGVVEYQYAIGKTPGGNDVVNWTLAGTATEVTKTDLNLMLGQTYYFAVKAKNSAGTWSSVGISDGITVRLPQIGVTPRGLIFYALVDYTNPDAQTLNITNLGYGTLNWAVSDDADWLSCSPASGDCTDETDEVRVSVDIASLTSGIYNAAITINAITASNTPQTVSVTLRVLSLLAIQAFSPVDLVVTDPKGRIVKKDKVTIPSWPGLPPASYTKADINGDGDPDVEVRIPGPITGDYSIEVVPEPNAKPTDTFTLNASYKDESKTLADNVEIQDMPTDPYTSFVPECDVDPGWNLISIPIKLSNNALGTVLQSITGYYSSVWTYDAEDGEWKRYIVDGPDFLNSLDTMEAGKGYWIQMVNPAVLTLGGDEVADEPIPLRRGWNLVGYNYRTARSVEQALSSIAGNYNSVWTYDAASSEWKRYIVSGPESLNNLEVMEPGRGYWINAIVDCIWIAPARVGSIFTISIPW